MQTLKCHKCGKTWIQHGNASGHCARCRETFYGIDSFDFHLQGPRRGTPITHVNPADNPPSPDRQGWLADGEGQWHWCKKTTAGTFNEYQALNPRPVSPSQRAAAAHRAA